MNNYTQNEINNIVSSNKELDEKIYLLKKEKKELNEYLSVINDAINKLETGSFVKNMKEEQKNLIAKATFMIYILIMSTNLTIVFYSKDNKGIIYNNNLDALLGIIGGYLSPAIAIYSGSMALKDIYNYSLYTQRINSYNRRLK